MTRAWPLGRLSSLRFGRPLQDPHQEGGWGLLVIAQGAWMIEEVWQSCLCACMHTCIGILTAQEHSFAKVLRSILTLM
jgi:hypothetical protein